MAVTPLAELRGFPDEGFYDWRCSDKASSIDRKNQ
jgi:hypothetical protein